MCIPTPPLFVASHKIKSPLVFSKEKAGGDCFVVTGMNWLCAIYRIAVIMLCGAKVVLVI